MSRWVCNNCGNHFEGGIFDTRECPKCSGFINSVIRFSLGAFKILVFIIPVILLIKILQKPLYDKMLITISNTLSIQTAVYYNPSFYFNKLFFVKEDNYYYLRNNQSVYQRIFYSKESGDRSPLLTLQTGQGILVKGIIPQKDQVWLGIEFINNQKRNRYFIVLPRNWEDYLTKIDYQNHYQAARNEFRDTALSQYANKIITGKDNISKFSEENPDYYREDIENISALKSLFAFVSSDYDVGYFFKYSDKDKIEQLKESFLDRQKIENKLIGIK